MKHTDEFDYKSVRRPITKMFKGKLHMPRATYETPDLDKWLLFVAGFAMGMVLGGIIALSVCR